MTPWFDQIGLVYARRHDEVEAARSAFLSQRQAIVDHLMDVCFKQLGTTCQFERGKASDGWEVIWLEGSHATARRELANKTKHQSGLSLGIGHDPYFLSSEGGCFGFGAYLFFAMGEGSYAKMKTQLSATFPVDYVDEPGSRGAFLRTAWITPVAERFALESFEQSVRELPEAFAVADKVVSTAYAKLKGG